MFVAASNALRFAGAYHNIVNMTDFDNAFSDGEITLHQRDVMDYMRHNPAIPFPWFRRESTQAANVNIHRLSAAGSANIDAQNLFTLGIATRPSHKTNSDIIVSVVDPGVGAEVDGKGNQVHDRSILVPHSQPAQGKLPVLIGPNNGSLALYGKYLEKQQIPYTVIPIDIDKVQALEQFRKKAPLAHTFHGRDLFGVIGAYIASGVDPTSFRDDKRPLHSLKSTPFADHITPLNFSQVAAKPQTFYAIFDPTYDGNLKTSLILREGDRAKVKNAQFEITGPNGHKEIVPFKDSFYEVPKGQSLIYLGSTFAPHMNAQKQPDSRFVELAVNFSSPKGFASAARRFGVTPNEAGQFTLRLVKPSPQTTTF
jgi:S-adenosylmethionine hydrolase